MKNWLKKLVWWKRTGTPAGPPAISEVAAAAELLAELEKRNAALQSHITGEHQRLVASVRTGESILTAIALQYGGRVDVPTEVFEASAGLRLDLRVDEDQTLVILALEPEAGEAPEGSNEKTDTIDPKEYA